MNASSVPLSGRHILIHTDGSCQNPGPGAYAAVLRRMDGDVELKKKTITGFEPQTTTSVRMEMTAAAVGLEAVRADEPEPIVIYSDNQLLSRGMSDWVHGWPAKGWRNSDGKPVANRDLWERLVAATTGKTVQWLWVKGHAGDPRNTEVDRLARTELEKARLAAFGFESDG